MSSRRGGLAALRFGRAPRPAPRSWASIAADIAAVLACAALPVFGWAREGARPAPEGPAWLFESDQYLFGPDAAAWAQNALALHQGRLGDLDPHRLPTWTLFTSWAMHLGGWDVAVAGHLVNRMEMVLLGPVVYLLGRSLGLGPFAFVAAALTAVQPALLASACRFGVDPTVTFLVPLTILTARWAGTRWWFAPVAGAVAGLTMVSHLTALGFPLAGLVVLLVSGRRWAPTLLGAVLFGLSVWAVFHVVFSVFPLLPGDFFENSLAEGIAPTGDDLTQSGRAAARGAALDTLRTNAPLAADGALRFILKLLRPTWLPWTAAIGLAWLGFVGPAAVTDRPVPRLRSAAREWAGRVGGSVVEGLAVASACAPLLAFAAAKSPERYSENLLPMAAIVLARGGATVVAAITSLLARFSAVSPWRRDLAFALGAVVAGAWTIGEWREPHQRASVLAPQEERDARLIGAALAETFPAGIGAASCLREALPYAGLRYCPNTVCPFRDDEIGYAECLGILRKECPGSGDIPLVVVDGLTPEQRPERRAHFEAWVETRLQPVTTAAGARIYALPRDGSI